MKHTFSLVWIILVLISVFTWAGSAEPVVDVDLSACSRGITYAQMIQVCNAPGEYDGKVFRLNGKFNYAVTQSTAKIIFSDNSGCCELALPFDTAEALTYPDDYPPLYSDITITAWLTVDRSNPDLSCRFSDAIIE